jgi:SRSO17 transposase
MTEQEVRELGPDLDRYLEPFQFCCAYTQTFEHLRTYCRGLLSDLPRKSAEPIALAAGTPPRSLQEFLKDHVWDQAAMIDIAQKHTAKVLPGLPDDEGLGTIGIVDETGQPKKGTKTPGVQRQWCGRLGKVDTCVVTVHLGVARGRFTALLGGDLFLPESWSDNRERCREAGIPDEVVYRPKWQIALEQLDLATGNGVCFDWLTFDEGYGETPAFLAGLAKRKQQFVGEVPKSLSCREDDGKGQPHAVDVAGRAERVLVPALGGHGVAVRMHHQASADEVWQAVEMTVWLRQGKGWSERPYRLIAAYNAQTGEIKYFVSNAAAHVSLVTILRAAFRRWPVERSFGIQKGDLAFGHYEGRNYTGLLRHMTICCLLGLFVAFRAAAGQKQNAELTVEQVGRGLRVVCSQLLRRGFDLVCAVVAAIAYYQKRNAQARISHKKRFVLPTFLMVDKEKMTFSLA